MRRFRWPKWLARGILGAIVLTLIPLVAIWWTGNFSTVVPGSVFRSGQLTATSLAKTLRTHKIRTVLNLRGPNPESAWYRAEREATLAEGATQVDVSMASDQWISRVQARTIVELLQSSKPPLLIHCQWGSERTGLVAAFVELLRPGGSIDSARSQFSLRHLFLPCGDGPMMTGHIDRYEQWLKREGTRHSPDEFRRWIADGYRPGSPSREEWPYDPYPLVVVTTPLHPPETVAETQPKERR